MTGHPDVREFQPGGRPHGTESMLGVRVAGEHWLVDMMDISEALPLPPLTPVPLTRPWFRGMISVRGNLYAVTDLAAYRDGGEVSGEADNRVLLVAERHACNAALLVDHVFGLRDPQEWTASEIDGEMQYRDEQGNLWRRLDIAGLLDQPDFLQIGI